MRHLATTSIEWADVSWNPIQGCTRVSRGCERCYAETMASRFSKPGLWGHGVEAARTAGDVTPDL